MKRLLVSLIAFSLSLFVLSAQDNDLKKDKMLFNHVAVGVSAGLDGVGGHVALPMGRHFSLRGGYTFIPTYNTKIQDIPIIGSKINAEDLQFTVNEGDAANERTFDLTKVDFGLTLNNFGPHLLLDLYPGKKSGFHFTVGAVMSQEKLLDASIDLSDQLTQDDIEHLGFAYKDIEISPDPNGVVHVDLRQNKIRPYVGIGFGRPLNMRHRVSVNFDLGVVYTGQMKVYSYDYHGVGGMTDEVQITSAGIDNEDDGFIDDKLAKCPVFPVMKLSINVRLF